MFQYAAGRALALRSNAELCLDLSFFSRRRHRDYGLNDLPIAASETEPLARSKVFGKLGGLFRAARNRYKEPHFHFDATVLELTAPVRIDGYFQSEKYFSDSADIIRAELAIPAATDAESLRLAEQLRVPNSAVIHVRRGDYLTNPKASKMFAECSLGYYQRAMQLLPGQAPIVVVSDDIAWAEANLPRSRELIFPTQTARRTALSDLWLMTQSHHTVIANSTFSWWGAWLSERSDSVTIAPQYWFNECDHSDEDLIPDRWLRIE